jgi:hypothetical protein
MASRRASRPTSQIEGEPARDPAASRRSVREAIERKYTAAASARQKVVPAQKRLAFD